MTKQYKKHRPLKVRTAETDVSQSQQATGAATQESSQALPLANGALDNGPAEPLYQLPDATSVNNATRMPEPSDEPGDILDETPPETRDAALNEEAPSGERDSASTDTTPDTRETTTPDVSEPAILNENASATSEAINPLQAQIPAPTSTEEIAPVSDDVTRLPTQTETAAPLASISYDQESDDTGEEDTIQIPKIPKEALYLASTLEESNDGNETTIRLPRLSKEQHALMSEAMKIAEEGAAPAPVATNEETTIAAPALNSDYADAEISVPTTPPVADAEISVPTTPPVAAAETGETAAPSIADVETQQLPAPSIADTKTQQLPAPSISDVETQQLPTLSIADTKTQQLPTLASADAEIKEPPTTIVREIIVDQIKPITRPLAEITTTSSIMEKGVVSKRVEVRVSELTASGGPAAHPLRPGWLKDRWLVATLVCACIASIGAVWYFFQNHQILLMGDTYSHMLIARRMIDSLTPGLAQVGGVWLPLPHLLMLPFIWNDYLWHTGLAGSFVAMPCYVISALYIFLTARRITHNNGASFVGALLFILNPNVLYVQSTPLSELVLIATLTMASYYFLAWAQEDNPLDLLRAAVGTFLATLTRYDGWPIFLAFLFLIIIIGWLKRRRREEIEGQLILFGLLGGLGIALWLLWCAIIFGDPLYWQHSEFSSQAQQQYLPQQLKFLHTNVLFTYHNVWQALRTYTLDSIYHVGPILFVLAIIGMIVFYLRRRLTAETVALAIFLVPFPYYVLSLFTAQAVIYVPGAAPAHASLRLNYYNVRYGIEMVAPAAIFLATLAGMLLRSPWFKRVGQTLLQACLCALIVIQALLTCSTGIISLQEGQLGLDCVQLDPVVLYLAQHYGGGRILSDTYFSSTTTLGPDAGVAFKNMIYEGSGTLWKQALKDPASLVDWVVANPKSNKDLVAQNLNVNGQNFLSQYTLEVQEQNGEELFHRTNAPPPPSGPIPIDSIYAHRLCGNL